MKRKHQNTGQYTQKNDFWLAFFIMLFALVGIGIHRVSMEYQVLEHGFEKSEAAQENRRLREQARRLEVEIAAEKMLETLSNVGNQHQMHYPQRGERILVASPKEN
tara:strand:+ start:58 stop:375 length:318 start_codon:yes stop_codon:yes gene_type:complete